MAIAAPSATPAVMAPFGPWYYPARYLHRHVTPLKPIRPAYPPGAPEGRVVIVLFINEHGGIDRYRIEASEPEGLFEESVTTAFVSQARYAPGMITGYPVRAELRAEIIFTPGVDPQINFAQPELIDPRPSQESASSRGKEN